MYLSRALLLNSGSISKLKLILSFDRDDLPKPTVLVRANGSGKTGVLSVVADALLEIAAQYFANALPLQGTGHQFFRVLGGKNQRLSSNFEFDALSFFHQKAEFLYRAKSGTVSPSSLASDLSNFPAAANWPEEGNEKIVIGPMDQIRTIYNNGTYLFFPASRYEIPHWANLRMLERDPDADFAPRFANKLQKPIVVQSGISEIKPWIVDLMLDGSVDFRRNSLCR